MAWEPDYCTVAELAAFARIGDALDDVQIGLAIAAASRAIDRTARRQFGQVTAPEPRTYRAWFDVLLNRWAVAVDDLMTTVGMAVAFDSAGDETYATAITAYSVRPSNAAATSRPWEELVILPGSAVQPTDADAGVRVTARWGWTAVPFAIRQACLLQASRVLMRRDSPYGIAGSPDAGSELRLLARVDPDVEVAVTPYKRRAGVVVFA